MSTALVSFHTAVEYFGAFAIFVLLLGVLVARDRVSKLKARRRPAAPVGRRVVRGDAWDTLPEKWEPPVARTGGLR